MVSVYPVVLESPRVTYHTILTVGVLTKFQDVPVHVGNYGMSVQNQLGLKREQLATAKQEHTERTLKT